MNAFALLITSRPHNGIDALLEQGVTLEGNQDRIIEAMRTIEDLLGAQPEHKVPYILRPPQSGDMVLVVYRHGVLYAEEYGWDERVRSSGGGYRRPVHPELRSQTRALSDRRERRREHRLGVSRQKVGHGGEAAPVVGRAESAGLGVGTRLVDECAFWQTGRLQKDRVVDEQRLIGRAAYL